MSTTKSACLRPRTDHHRLFASLRQAESRRIKKPAPAPRISTPSTPSFKHGPSVSHTPRQSKYPQHPLPPPSSSALAAARPTGDFITIPSAHTYSRAYNNKPASPNFREIIRPTRHRPLWPTLPSFSSSLLGPLFKSTITTTKHNTPTPPGDPLNGQLCTLLFSPIQVCSPQHNNNQSPPSALPETDSAAHSPARQTTVVQLDKISLRRESFVDRPMIPDLGPLYASHAVVSPVDSTFAGLDQPTRCPATQPRPPPPFALSTPFAISPATRTSRNSSI